MLIFQPLIPFQFFISFFKNNITYLFLVGRIVCERTFLWLWGAVFLLWWHLWLQIMGSRVTGFTSCGSWALELGFSNCGTQT